MLALLYLILSFGVGCLLLRLFFPTLFFPALRSLQGQEVPLYRPFLVLPAGFCLGYILLGWVAYLSAWLARDTGRPMAFGAGAALVAGLLLTGAELLTLRRRAGSGAVWRDGRLEKANRRPGPSAARFFAGGFGPWQTLALVFSLAAGLFVSFYSFWEDASSISMAVNIYSDFSPHIAVIRSFSLGENFPTQYPHFADGTIRYHFLFLFAAGLLEYLGLPLTWALNLPSLLSFLSMMLLLFTLAHALTGSRGAAFLSLVFLFFRSSFAFFSFLAQKPEDTGWLGWLLNNKTFIGTTTHEDWGLFNQNVWANQRHLSLGVCLVLLALLLFLPLLQEGVATLSRGPSAFLFAREGWAPSPALFWGLPAGLLLGVAAFWHGSMVISALLILAGMGIFSRARLTYLFTALPAMALSSLQSAFFTKGASPLSLQIHLGFLAPSGSAGDVAEYLLLLTGIFFPLFLAGLIWAGGGKGRGATRVFFLSCLLPLVQAFTLQMTPDIAVGHKQVMLSLILGGILNGWLLTTLWKSRRLPRRGAALAAAVLLTITGLEDGITYSNLCRSTPVRIQQQSALTDWIREETPAGSVFITGYITIHPVFTAGRLAYQGWPYYAWSAGYDTTGRDQVLEELFACRDPEAFAQAARDTGADYLLVDSTLTGDERFSAFFGAGGEEILRQALPVVYQDEGTTVYQIR